MEYVDGATVRREDDNQRFTLLELKSLLAQALDVLAHLSGLQITHRDIKLDNILVANRYPLHIKIIDFDIAGSAHHMETYTGPTGYMAPEIRNNDMNPRLYDNKVDIWSLGIAGLDLLSGLPENNPSVTDLIAQLGSNCFGSAYHGVIAFMSYCLEEDPTCRLSADELLRFHCLEIMQGDSSIILPPRSNAEMVDTLVPEPWTIGRIFDTSVRRPLSGQCGPLALEREARRSRTTGATIGTPVPRLPLSEHDSSIASNRRVKRTKTTGATLNKWRPVVISDHSDTPVLDRARRRQDSRLSTKSLSAGIRNGSERISRKSCQGDILNLVEPISGCREVSKPSMDDKRLFTSQKSTRQVGYESDASHMTRQQVRVHRSFVYMVVRTQPVFLRVPDCHLDASQIFAAAVKIVDTMCSTCFNALTAPGNSIWVPFAEGVLFARILHLQIELEPLFSYATGVLLKHPTRNHLEPSMQLTTHVGQQPVSIRKDTYEWNLSEMLLATKIPAADQHRLCLLLWRLGLLRAEHHAQAITLWVSFSNGIHILRHLGLEDELESLAFLVPLDFPSLELDFLHMDLPAEFSYLVIDDHVVIYTLEDRKFHAEQLLTLAEKGFYCLQGIKRLAIEHKRVRGFGPERGTYISLASVPRFYEYAGVSGGRLNEIISRLHSAPTVCHDCLRETQGMAWK